MSSVRVLIADDQYVTRTGLTAMAQSSPDLSVAGEAYDAEGTIKATAELTPDVVLVNLRMLQADDLQGLVDEISTASAVIVLRSRDSHVGVEEALRAEVAGFADLDALEGQLANLVSLVRRGYAVCVIANKTLQTAMRKSYSAAIFPPPWISILTAREGEVLRLIAAGMTNKQIAAKLHVAESTVKKHSCRVMKKMGVSSRVEAALQFSHYGDVTIQWLAAKHR
jgi:DNA-binding NarL/FixJ family response regulator